MRDSSHQIQICLVIIILMVLIVPIILGTLKIKPLPLKGAISQVENKKINIKEWFTGDYQIQKETYLNESFGFRSFFIRINNQIAFSLFNQVKAKDVIIGKNNYLFEENYLKAYYGKDFIGIDSITHRLQRFKFIQDTLLKLNKNIFLVFAAGKGSFYPEYFPDHVKCVKGPTNYDFYIKIAHELGINYIDFNKYFIDNKYKSKYPLYPKYGIHWSIYGSWIAGDSIISYIENMRNIDMANFLCKNIIFSQPKGTDYDIGDGLNLLFHLRSFKMAYPQMDLITDSSKVKPSLLAVSDSFYWLLFGSGFTNAFGENQFWFYNKEVYPGNSQGAIAIDQIDVKEEILKKDIIIIMATEATLSSLGWGFIENTYNIFKGLK
jgi:hypothetical protein